MCLICIREHFVIDSIFYKVLLSVFYMEGFFLLGLFYTEGLSLLVTSSLEDATVRIIKIINLFNFQKNFNVNKTKFTWAKT